MPVSGSLIHLSYKNSTGGGVPSPVDASTPNQSWPLDFWASQLQTLATHGATVPILPPMPKGASLGANYDPHDDYDLGSRLQGGRRETRYGSKEQARRFGAIAARNGMEVAVNVVHHHRDGGKNQIYTYPDAAGNPTGGEFPKDQNCFWTWSKEQQQNPDHVPDPTFDGGIWAYGDEFRWLSGTYGDGKGTNGAGYVARNLIDALKWQMRCLGCKQIFWDDLKGTSANYIAWASNELRASGIADFVWGEMYDGNPQTLMNYISSYPIVRTCGVLDFNDHFALRAWCNYVGMTDIRSLINAGIPDKANSVTFDEDADTNLSGPIVSRMLQASAAIAFREGYPMFFGKNIWKLAGAYGMENPILRLLLVHSHCANGPTIWRATSFHYLVGERPWAPGLLFTLSNKVGLHSRPGDWQEVYVLTSWWPGTRIYDATGHSTEIKTIDSNGGVLIPIPPSSAAGDGYSAWVQVDSLPLITPAGRAATHHFYGRPGLDDGPATQTGTLVSRWIWCDEKTPINLKKISGDGVNYSVTDAAGNTIIPIGNWSGETKMRGKHIVTAYAPTETNYEVNIEYWGTRDLTDAEIKAEIPVHAAEVPVSPITIGHNDLTHQLFAKTDDRRVIELVDDLKLVPYADNTTNEDDIGRPSNT